ncbi:cohesin complex subunit, partial [Coemansia sp. RSA 2424]
MKSKKNASVQDDSSTTLFQSQLLDAILDEKTALAQIVNDWIGRYRSTGGDAATSELLNFLIKLTGTTTSAPPVTAATLYDDVTETLDDLQAQSIAALQRNEGEDDLLMGKTKEHRRIRKSVLQFLVKLVSDGQHHLLFDEVNEESRLSPFIEALLQWLVSMAGSSYRPFRHVATLAALCVQTAVVGIRTRISVELQTTHRQLETEAKRGSSSSRRGGGGGSGKQQQQLRDRVAQLSQQDEVAEAAFKAFYDTVFIYRYRDVQATIRSECIVPLATWCRAFPAAYLDTEYLRYLGWALNDKDARVRETALAAIGGPLLLGKQPTHGGVGSGVGGCGGIAGTAAAAASSAEDSVAEGIRPFIGRFLPRIVQVAAGDIDVKVQVAALKLVALLGKHQYLDPTAKIGDIRSIKKSGQKAQKKKKKPKKKTLLSRGSYSNSLSQQLLEESSSEEEEEEEETEEAAAAGGGGVIEIQTLYELNAEDEEEEEAGQLGCPRHTTMRFLAPLVTHAQAAVRGAAAELVAWWVREDWARAARVAALGLGHAHDEHEDEDEGEDGDESEDEDDDDDASAEDLLRTAGGRRRVQRWAVFKAVAAFLARLVRGDQQAEAEADDDFGGADDDDDGSGGPARLLAAAAALWGRVAELGSLAALAAFLGRDHSQQRRRRAFALAGREETALLQAFAAWVQEPGDHPRAARKAAPGGRSSAAAAAGSKGWQAALPRLLARNGDSAARTAALAGAAAAALDVQALFDADRGACVEAVAQHLSAALQRHAACARVMRPAAAFLARVDGSAVLRERWCLLAAVQAAGAARVVALRALLRVADVASAVRVGDLLALAQEAAEGVALAALDAALHAVLWRAAGALTGAEGLRTDPDVEGLRTDAAALLATCEALADAAAGGRPRLAELAFVALGRVLR